MAGVRFRRNRMVIEEKPSGAATTAAAPVPVTAALDVLERPFRAIIFDWDGTAVVDRQEDATALAGLIAELERLKVWIVVVTGTNVGNIDRQLVRLLPPPGRHHLLVCVNRGSEVYGFDRRGGLVRRWLRVATPDEDRALTIIAERVRDVLTARTGLDIRIISDRLT